jgi:hypothetical protein
MIVCGLFIIQVKFLYREVYAIVNQIQSILKTNVIDIKDLTSVRGQDGKISDTQGKDFWSPARLSRVGDQ